jgi:hypothetical protein
MTSPRTRCSPSRDRPGSDRVLRPRGHRLRRAGRPIDDDPLAHIWPSHHSNVNFYGTHPVDIDSELAKLDADSYRLLRLSAQG